MRDVPSRALLEGWLSAMRQGKDAPDARIDLPDFDNERRIVRGDCGIQGIGGIVIPS